MKDTLQSQSSDNHHLSFSLRIAHIFYKLTYVTWLIKEESRYWQEQWMHVWATNRVGLFSVLAVNAVHWCVLIRLWEHRVLIVFPSLPQSTATASSSPWCYYGEIRLPSYPASVTPLNAATWGGFCVWVCCVCVCVCDWEDRWLCIRLHNVYFLHSKCNKWVYLWQLL